MNVPVSDAKDTLTQLVHRAESGFPIWRCRNAGMIVADTSALMAMPLDEPEKGSFAKALADERVLVSAAACNSLARASRARMSLVRDGNR